MISTEKIGEIPVVEVYLKG